MFCVYNFILIILIFLVFLFLKLFWLLFLGLLNLCFQVKDLVVLLKFSGFCWDELFFAFLRSWVRIEPIGKICDREVGPFVKNLGESFADDMADLVRGDLFDLLLNIHFISFYPLRMLKITSFRFKFQVLNYILFTIKKSATKKS